MSILARIKAAFSNERWLESTMTVLRGEEAKRAPFSQQAAVSAYRSWVYAAANLNAVSVASQPLRLYVKNRSAGTKLWNTRKASRRVKAYMAGDLEQLPSRYVMSKAAEYGNDFEVVEDSHPILTLLSKVNPYQNGFDATILRILFLELTGNSYLHPVIDKRLKIPVELWTMPAQYVEIVPGKEQFIDGYLYGATREQRRVFTPEEVIHFKRPNPGDMYYGLGKVEAAWGATMANEAVHEMDHAFFANKARPDYLLVVKSPAHPDEIERLEVQIDEKLRGSKRSGRFLTTTGDIDLKPLSFPPKDLAGRTEIVEEIAAVFGVPVSMLKANDPNLASATVGFASWKATTILPLLRMDEETLNQNLLPLFGIEEDAFLAYDNPVSEDERFEFEKIRSMVAGGIITVNEARMREGLDAVEDPMADSLLVNGQPLGGAPPAPPPMGAASATNPLDGLVGPLDTAPDLDEPPEPQPERKDALSDCVSEKVAKLIEEGYPQDQAVAIAYSMCAEGKSSDDSAASLGIEKKAIGDIDTRPPQGVADNARRALDVRARKPESERGMTPVGIARARDLMNRSRLSEDTIRRMLAYFERHEVDKEGSTWDEQGRGWQAWNGWGGDDGFAWARRKVEEFNRERERKRLGKSCGCRSNSTSAAKVEFKDCGTGAGGFQSGNTCGEEEGGSDSKNESRSSAMSIPRARDAGGGVVEVPIGNGDAPVRAKQITESHDKALTTWMKGENSTVEQHDEIVRSVGSKAGAKYQDAARSWSMSDQEEELVQAQRAKLKGEQIPSAIAKSLEAIETQARQKLPKPQTVVRGFRVRGPDGKAFADSLKEGKEIATGIISTSTSQEVALEFAGAFVGNKPQTRVLFRIKTDRGIVVSANPAIRANEREAYMREIVIAPKQIRVTGRTVVRTRTRAVMGANQVGKEGEWDTVMIDAEAVYE